MQMLSPELSYFTPSMMKPALLEAVFVKRAPMLEHLLTQVHQGLMGGSLPQVLLMGPRGMGKTHLISLLYHRAAALPDVQERACIAWLKEEEWSVDSWLELLRVILQALLQRDPLAKASGVSLKDQLATLHHAGSIEEATRRVEQLLLSYLAGRRMLLLMENLDQIFEGLQEEGQRRWRAFLQTHANTCIVATSQSLFAGITAHSQPFYGFFRQEHLESFTLDDACQMLAGVARARQDEPLACIIEQPEGRARVRAVGHFAGGNPRVYMILSQFLTRENLDELVQPFMRMLNELTPYYQSRMQTLSPQQRKLVEYLCLERKPISVKEMSQKTFIKPQTVSSQLRRLEELGYVVGREAGRETLYELREPLMRLTIEVKLNRGEGIPIFLDFLRLWYPQQELKRQLDRLPAFGLSCTEERRHLRMALELTEQAGDDPRVAACLQDLKQYVQQENWADTLKVTEELVALRGKGEDYLARAQAKYELDDVSGATMDLEEALNRELSPQAKWEAKMELAFCYWLEGENTKALEQLQRMSKKVQKNDNWQLLMMRLQLEEGNISTGMALFQQLLEKTERDSSRLENLLSWGDPRQFVSSLTKLNSLWLISCIKEGLSYLELYLQGLQLKAQREETFENDELELFFLLSIVLSTQPDVLAERWRFCDASIQRQTEHSNALSYRLITQFYLEKSERLPLGLLLHHQDLFWLEILRGVVEIWKRALQDPRLNLWLLLVESYTSLVSNITNIMKEEAERAQDPTQTPTEEGASPAASPFFSPSSHEKLHEVLQQAQVLTGLPFSELIYNIAQMLLSEELFKGRPQLLVALLVLRYVNLEDTHRRDLQAQLIEKSQTPELRSILSIGIVFFHEPRLANTSEEQTPELTSPAASASLGEVDKTSHTESLEAALSDLFHQMKGHVTPEDWRSFWTPAFDSLPELATFFRILEVAEAYRQKPERRILLTLPLEERMIVAEYLKLTHEQAAID
ncbi:MAG: AAA family ATPase [Myxococcota bacterium]